MLRARGPLSTARALGTAGNRVTTSLPDGRRSPRRSWRRPGRRSGPASAGRRGPPTLASVHRAETSPFAVLPAEPGEERRAGRDSGSAPIALPTGATAVELAATVRDAERGPRGRRGPASNTRSRPSSTSSAALDGPRPGEGRRRGRRRRTSGSLVARPAAARARRWPRPALRLARHYGVPTGRAPGGRRRSLGDRRAPARAPARSPAGRAADATVTVAHSRTPDLAGRARGRRGRLLVRGGPRPPQPRERPGGRRRRSTSASARVPDPTAPVGRSDRGGRRRRRPSTGGPRALTPGPGRGRARDGRVPHGHRRPRVAAARRGGLDEPAERTPPRRRRGRLLRAATARCGTAPRTRGGARARSSTGAGTSGT